jgi:uncharacterized protein Yka (UPF0111/DUF47 family)
LDRGFFGWAVCLRSLEEEPVVPLNREEIIRILHDVDEVIVGVIAALTEAETCGSR